jgi:hypothetical protein
MKPQGVCRANPPQLLMAIQQMAAMPGQQSPMRQVPTALFPEMADTGWCRSHQPRLEEIDLTKLELEDESADALH